MLVEKLKVLERLTSLEEESLSSSTKESRLVKKLEMLEGEVVRLTHEMAHADVQIANLEKLVGAKEAEIIKTVSEMNLVQADLDSTKFELLTVELPILIFLFLFRTLLTHTYCLFCLQTHLRELGEEKRQVEARVARLDEDNHHLETHLSDRENATVGKEEKLRESHADAAATSQALSAEVDELKVSKGVLAKENSRHQSENRRLLLDLLN
ncbi:hypothetical protein L1987_39919 [Smallanthus sonchifolius]|uniref:Uncharacterized protein n=1 Tax=Smallanthus sonchifolius TaxID=185202 RepID=A0ACB9GSY6_9ASTR|nr:hypothetical protein L1987_39919 [Smallanthus sonchifolius]